MDFDATNLIAGIVVSGIGYVLFTYGRRMSRPPHLSVGLVLLVYPYFVPDALIMSAIAVVLLALLGAAVKFGY